MSKQSLSLPVDLEDLALELGATLHRNDGSVFNSAGRSGITRIKKQAPPEQASAPAPVAPVPSGHDTLTAALSEMMSKLHLQQPSLPAVHVPPAQVVVQPAARCAWDFVFTRNRDGSIQSIRATPVKE